MFRLLNYWVWVSLTHGNSQHLNMCYCYWSWNLAGIIKPHSNWSSLNYLKWTWYTTRGSNVSHSLIHHSFRVLYQSMSCPIKFNHSINSRLPTSWIFLIAVDKWLIKGNLIKFSYFRYKRHSKRLLQPRVLPEPYGAGAPVLYSEPIYGPM